MQSTKIEYTDSTWNPVCGCSRGCEYCFARKIAERFKGCDIAPSGKTDLKIVELEERLKSTAKNGTVRTAPYPYGFTPTFHKYRLGDLDKKAFGKTIFVCDMADLFADRIPLAWISAVFDACKAHPEHRYLFLTKNPSRYYSLANLELLPKEDNFWYGTTVTTPMECAFVSKEYHTFLSVEPILEPFPYEMPEVLAKNTDWFIIGAETGRRKGKVVPERSWLEPIVESALRVGKPIFMKDSLKPIWGEDIITMYPWDD